MPFCHKRWWELVFRTKSMVSKTQKERRKEILSNLRYVTKLRKSVEDGNSKIASDYYSGKTSLPESHKKLKKDFGGKSPKEWIKYYDKHIEFYRNELISCNRRARAEDRLSTQKKIVVFVTLISLIILVSLFLFVKQPAEVFLAPTHVATFTQNLDLVITENSDYIWTLENSGELMLVKLSGSFQGEGQAKIYLEDGSGNEWLILDSTNLNALLSPVEDFTGNVTENTTSLGNDTEIVLVNETTFDIEFTEICEATCDLSSFNLNEESYNLRIEVNDSVLTINSVEYGISVVEEENLGVEIVSVDILEDEVFVGDEFTVNVEIVNHDSISYEDVNVVLEIAGGSNWNVNPGWNQLVNFGENEIKNIQFKISSLLETEENDYVITVFEEKSNTEESSILSLGSLDGGGEFFSREGEIFGVGEYVGVIPYLIDGARDFYVQGNYVYIVSFNDDSLTVIDISDETNPLPVAQYYSYLDGPDGVFVSGNYAYIVSSISDSLVIVDISNPLYPSYVGQFNNLLYIDNPSGVFVSGNYAYVISIERDNFLILDVSVPENPTFVFSIVDTVPPYSLENPNDVYVEGDYAYVTSSADNSLTIINVANKARPRSIGQYIGTSYLLYEPAGVYIEGNYAYITSFSGNSLTIVDIISKNNPVGVGQYINSNPSYLLDGAWNVFVSEDLAYVASRRNDALTVIDVSDKYTPTPIGQYVNSVIPYSIDAAWDVFVSGDRAYVSSYFDDSFNIFDISYFTSPSPNTAPTINIISVDNEAELVPDELIDLIPGDLLTPVEIIFEVTDVDGVDDINDFSTLDITYDYLDGVDSDIAGGVNDCMYEDNLPNTRIYTCSLNMEHYAGPGAWNAIVNVDDFGGLSADQATLGFSVNLLWAISLNPIIDFPEVFPGDTNEQSLLNTIVINDGNFDIPTDGSLKIISQPLFGQIDGSKIISGNNFKSSNEDILNVCLDGTQLIESSSVIIPGIILPRGSLSELFPTAEIQHCLKSVPLGLSAQPYSTQGYTAWEIIVSSLMAGAGVVPVRRKKKLKKDYGELVLQILGDNFEELLELVKENKLKAKSKGIEVPINIFKQNISPAEALCKYLKENEGLKYNEIAMAINRDQRTVWINYRNAVEKKKEKIKIIAEQIFIPIETFNDRRLSVLESVIKYMKDKGISNSEIAKMLDKVASNIWTLNSRMMKKLEV